MTLFDINILVYAHRNESPFYPVVSEWLKTFVENNQTFALTSAVTAGFLRIVTHPRIYDLPSDIATATLFVENLLMRPNCTVLEPGAQHWQLFSTLCNRLNACGNAVPDLHLAALALEANCDFASADRGFGRIPGLKWYNPLDG